MAAVSRHCCSNKRTLIKYGYLKPVRLCNKCNASCFKADLLLNAVCTSRGVRARVRVCMASNLPLVELTSQAFGGTAGLLCPG
jgi:hypothetical protein